VSLRARRACASPAEAERLRRALAADSPPYLHLAAEGSDLVIAVTAATAASLRATLEDLLACLQAAERAPS
jgi:hypothetical protein